METENALRSNTPAPRSGGQWISCNAPYGAGGLGLHLAHLVEHARANGELGGYSCARPRTGDEQIGQAISSGLAAALLRWSPARYSPGWKSFIHVDAFDRAVASAMAAAPESLVAFVGQALHSFRKARRLGTSRLILVAANSHVSNVATQHRLAIKRYPLESSWLNRAQIAKTLREYALADQIHVATDYTFESFAAQGVPAEKLVKVPLTVSDRFTPAGRKPFDGVFRIVYVGSLTVAKGIPLLVDAFEKLSIPNAELVLVGGWATRGMKAYLRSACARNARIKLRAGDPLPHLLQASVCVHPTYEDGFAYAPMEAKACGVPVIVSSDTGMKEYVEAGVDGNVFPTGDLDALISCIRDVYREKV